MKPNKALHSDAVNRARELWRSAKKMQLPILILTAALLVGCSSTSVTRYGDAMVKRTDRVTAFDIKFAAKVVYELDFPPVSLAQHGTTTFKARDIKPGMVPTDVTLRYPQHSSLGTRDLSDQWGDAEFHLRIVAVGSGETFSHTFSLAEANWGYNAAISDRAHFALPLTGYPLNTKFKIAQWSQVTDYDVIVTVTKPTHSGSHRLELTGVFPVFFDEAEINNAEQGSAHQPATR